MKYFKDNEFLRVKLVKDTVYFDIVKVNRRNQITFGVCRNADEWLPDTKDKKFLLEPFIATMYTEYETAFIYRYDDID